MSAKKWSGCLAAAVLLLCSGCGDEEPEQDSSAGSSQTATDPASGTDSDPLATQGDPIDVPPDPPVPVDPEELSDLWRTLAIEPDLADADQKLLFEALFSRLLPPLDADLEGLEWQLMNALGSGVAEMHVDLFRGGSQIVAIDFQYLLDTQAVEKAPWGSDTLAGYRSNSRGRFVFVRAGAVELRATGVAKDWRDGEKLGALVQRFPLDTLASL